MRWRNGIPPLALAMGLIASCTSIPNGGLNGGNPLGGSPTGTPTPKATPTLDPSPDTPELKPSRLAGLNLTLEGVGPDRHTDTIFPLTREKDRQRGNGLFYFTISNGKAKVVGVDLPDEGQYVRFQKSSIDFWKLKAAPDQGYENPLADGGTQLDVSTVGTYYFKADYQGGTYYGAIFVRYVLFDTIEVDVIAQLVSGETNLTPSAPGYRDAYPDEVVILPSPSPTPSASPTASPTPTPIPTQPPTIYLNGSGTRPSDVFTVRGGLTKFGILQIGDRRSEFKLINSNGDHVETLSWGYTSYYGERGVRLEPGDYLVNVESGGTWQVKVDQLPYLADAPATKKFSGTHSGLAGPFKIGKGLKTVAATYNGSSNFIVELLDADGDSEKLLVNKIGSYSGAQAVGFEDKVYYIDVIAREASWSIEISP